MLKLNYDFKNAWESVSSDKMKAVMNYGEEYKRFLDNGKTERTCCAEIVKTAKENGFVSLDEKIKNKSISVGDKIYAVNKDKGVILVVIGKNEIEKGMRILGAHIDSPRLDLKQFPLYEDSSLALLKTHYYGGIKKYQWTAIPLSMHGVVFKKDGSKVDITIGEDDNDPVLYISDLLIHLAKDQMDKKLGDAVTGEGLNVIIGHMPNCDSQKDKIKSNILSLLNDKYNMTEEDFLSAEIEIVPSGKARDVGLDRG